MQIVKEEINVFEHRKFSDRELLNENKISIKKLDLRVFIKHGEIHVPY